MEPLSMDQAIRELAAQVMSRSGKSRAQIADEMTQLLGLTINVNMLYGYTAPNRHSARFPAAFVPAFCKATDDDSLLRFLLGGRLCTLLELGERAFDALQHAPQRRTPHRQQRTKRNYRTESNSQLFENSAVIEIGTDARAKGAAR